MEFKKHHQVNIFVAPGSRHCELVKDYFRGSGIDFFEYDISRDKTSQLRMEEISNQTEVPVVEFDGRVVIGYRPDMYDILTGLKKE